MQLVFISSSFGQKVDSLAHPGYHTILKEAQRLYHESLPYQSLVEVEKLKPLAENDPMLTAVANYMSGENYILTGQFQRAYEELLPAVKYFREHKNHHYLPQVYSAIARLKFRRGELKSSLDYYQKALEIYKTKEEIDNIYKVEGNMGIVYAADGQKERGLKIFRSLVESALANEDTTNAIPAYLNISTVFINSDEIDSAVHYITKARRLSKRFDHKIGLANANFALSTIHFSRGEYSKGFSTGDSAIHLYREIGNLKNVPEILERKAGALNNKGNHKEAFQVISKLSTLKDSLYNKEKEAAVAEAEGKFKLSEKENEIALLEAQNQAEQNKQWLFILLLALAVSIGIAFFIRMRNLTRIRKAENRVHEQEIELEQARREKLQSELDMKVRSLTKEGLRIIQKNKQLEELQEKLEKLDKDIPDESRSGLQDIRSSLKFAFNTDRDWKEFSVYFEEVHPSFLSALSAVAPNLTTKEKRLSSLLRVGMSTKEIASVLGISPDSVKKARNRLRKKLNINADQDLSNFLENIELTKAS
ncbi:LuxR C-terminal-related transcriptional regulator [Halocola ammonii]